MTLLGVICLRSIYEKKVILWCDSVRKGGLNTFLDSVNIGCNDVEFVVWFPKAQASIFSDLTAKTKAVGIFSSRCVIGGNAFRHRVGRGLLRPLLVVVQTVILVWYFRGEKGDPSLMVVSGGFPGSETGRSAAYAWKLITGKRCIFNVHNFAVRASLLSPLYLISERFYDWLLSFCVAKYIAVSNACGKSLSDARGIMPSKIEVILNGVGAPNVVGPECSVDACALKSIAIVGTLEERKGHSVILKSLAAIEEERWILHIIGDGSPNEYQALRKEVRRLGIEGRVLFHGYVSSPFETLDIKPHVLVVPSQEYESFGMVVVEAWYRGIPVIGSDIEGLNEVLEFQQIPEFCIERFADSEAWSIVLKKLLNIGAEEYLGISRKVPLIARQQFGLERMCKQYRKVFFKNEHI